MLKFHAVVICVRVCRSLNFNPFMDVDAKPDKPQRVEALWFEDGNIILQAGTAQYRVYRGTLARESGLTLYVTM